MPTTESRYIPVVNIIAGTVAGVFLTKLLVATVNFPFVATENRTL